jgi:hypothetical protein
VCGIPELVSLVPSLVSLVDKFSDPNNVIFYVKLNTIFYLVRLQKITSMVDPIADKVSAFVLLDFIHDLSQTQNKPGFHL